MFSSTHQGLVNACRRPNPSAVLVHMLVRCCCANGYTCIRVLFRVYSSLVCLQLGPKLRDCPEAATGQAPSPDGSALFASLQMAGAASAFARVPLVSGTVWARIKFDYCRSLPSPIEEGSYCLWISSDNIGRYSKWYSVFFKVAGTVIFELRSAP